MSVATATQETSAKEFVLKVPNRYADELTRILDRRQLSFPDPVTGVTTSEFLIQEKDLEFASAMLDDIQRCIVNMRIPADSLESAELLAFEYDLEITTLKTRVVFGRTLSHKVRLSGNEFHITRFMRDLRKAQG